jgi:hypothetical protein
MAMRNAWSGFEGNPEETPKYTKDPVDGEPQIPMTGRVARMHNITYVPMSEEEKEDEGHYYIPEENDSHPFRLYSNEPLYSSQSHFGTRGVRKYIDTPPGPNHKPVIFPDDDGALWIHDGHHRIIASRLRGEPYIDVMRHESWEDNNDPDWIHKE